MLSSVRGIWGRILQITKMTRQGRLLCVCLIPENSTLFSLLIAQEVTKTMGFLPFPVGAGFVAMGPSEVEPLPDRVNSF